MKSLEAAQPMVWLKLVSTIGRLVLAGVWLWAGISKVADPSMAVRAVQGYEIVPEIFVKPVAWGLPFVEIGIAALLVLGIGTRIAAVLSLVLLVAFIAGVGSAWARGLQIACGCFGGGGADPSATWWTYGLEILRDVGFGAMAAWLIAHPESYFTLARRSQWHDRRLEIRH